MIRLSEGSPGGGTVRGDEDDCCVIRLSEGSPGGSTVRMVQIVVDKGALPPRAMVPRPGNPAKHKKSHH